MTHSMDWYPACRQAMISRGFARKVLVMLKPMLRLTNRRVRFMVGLLLAGLFCVQCTRTDAVSESRFVTSVSGRPVGATSADVLNKLEKMAKSDHVALLQFCLENYQNSYRDYTCTFSKQERMGGDLKPEQVMNVKFMDSPFSVTMTWTKNAPTADKLIYVEGKWDNQMLVKPNLPFAGLIGTVRRPPDGQDARRQSLRTVNQFGMRRSLQSLIDVYAKAAQAGDLGMAFGGYRVVDGRDTILLIRDLPEKGDYPAARTLTYIDLAYLVPICVEAFDANEELNSRYVFSNLRFNVGLTEDAFLPEANGMQPPK